MNKKYVLFFIILVLCLGCLIFGYYISKAVFLNSFDYESETKAFDVGEHQRCDFYIEYLHYKIINITLTDCIKT